MVEADGGYHSPPVSNARINTVRTKEETAGAGFDQILLRNGLVGNITARLKSQGKKKKKEEEENSEKEKNTGKSTMIGK